MNAEATDPRPRSSGLRGVSRPSQGQGKYGPFSFRGRSGNSAGERRFLCACIPKNVAVSSNLETTQCPSGVAKEINAKWFVYSVPRYLTINNLYLELYSYGKIVKETKDGPDV